jgi:hypothetical protein
MRGRECRSTADQCERNETDKSVRLLHVEGHEEEVDRRNLWKEEQKVERRLTTWTRKQDYEADNYENCS